MNIRKQGTLRTLIVAGFLFAGLAHGADVGTKAGDTRSAAPRAVKSDTTSTPIGVSTPQLASMSQQDKMKECNRLAKGQKGAERKTFMKGCLSKKKA